MAARYQSAVFCTTGGAGDAEKGQDHQAVLHIRQRPSATSSEQFFIFSLSLIIPTKQKTLSPSCGLTLQLAWQRHSPQSRLSTPRTTVFRRANRSCPALRSGQSPPGGLGSWVSSYSSANSGVFSNCQDFTGGMPESLTSPYAAWVTSMSDWSDSF